MICEELINSIAEKLSEEFAGKDIYTYEVKQGISVPCFFILPISVSDIRHVGRRRLAEYLMCVQYIPASEETYAECAGVEEKMYKLLEFADVGGARVAGTGFRSETTDEAMSLFVSYRMLTLETPAGGQEKMDSYVSNVDFGGKNGA